MSAWDKALITGIYTMSPLHVSTGQAEGAIDLPVAKESHTHFPVIPASSLKGVARDAFERALDNKDTSTLFGPSIKKTDDDSRTQDTADTLYAGNLVFTEAKLVAYAARSLTRPFLYVTCRLVLERLARDARAAKIKALGELKLPSSVASNVKVLVADKPLADKTLVIEDWVYAKGECELSSDVVTIAQALAKLLPADEPDTRARFEKSLVVIPDQDFASLVRRLPVRARIKLNDDTKTTGGDDGNLWYEEQVPPDCLFVSFIGARASRKKGSASTEAFHEKAAQLAISQIGGNETVGEGICAWTVLDGNGQGGRAS